MGERARAREEERNKEFLKEKCREAGNRTKGQPSEGRAMVLKNLSSRSSLKKKKKKIERKIDEGRQTIMYVFTTRNLNHSATSHKES